MQWSWATTLDQLWRSPAFPVWAAVAVAAFAALMLLILVLRADRTLANVMLAVIACLALGVAAIPLLRGPTTALPMAVSSGPVASNSPSPAVACLDGLAGEAVEDACERAIFASPETVAAAVSYAAMQLVRLGAPSGSPAAQQALVRAIEQDRYGLVAQVLTVRERCTPGDCAVFLLLSHPDRIKANMAERLYEGMVARYSPVWSTAPAIASVSTMPASVPTGKPTTQDFPSSASIPPVNIMTPEPPPRAAPAPSPRPAAASAAPPSEGNAAARAQAPAAKKPPVPSNSKAAAPRSLTPPQETQAADD